MHRLSRRVRQVEKRSGVDRSFVLFPLPDKPEQSVRLPRSFVDFLAKKRSAGYGNYPAQSA